MLLWLPLSVSNALAVSMSMQLQHADCHETEMQDMQLHDMTADMHQHDQPSHGQQDNSCNGCGACHLACNAYLDAPVISMPALPLPAQQYTQHLVSFTSVTTTPLLPPPLARA